MVTCRLKASQQELNLRAIGTTHPRALMWAAEASAVVRGMEFQAPERAVTDTDQEAPRIPDAIREHVMLQKLKDELI